MAFILIFSSILGLMYGYVGWRIMVPAELTPPWNVAVWGLIFLFWLAIPLRFVFWFSRIDSEWVDRMARFGYAGLALFSILFVLFITRDILWLIYLLGDKGISIARELLGAEPVTVAAMNPERRRFIINMVNAGIVGFTGLYTGWGFYTARSRFRIKNIDFRIKNLPEEFDGFSILQISDIHVGPTIKRDFVRRIVSRVDGIKPDLIALTGDLADGSVRNLAEDVAPLKELEAPHGKYFVTGNHEYYSGVKPWVEHIGNELGFRVLNNEHILISRGKKQIVLAGVTDIESIRMDPENATDPIKAIEGTPDGLYKILLAHQPKSVFKAAEAGFDLQISGHTHGGQFYPWNYIVALQQPFLKGVHKYKGMHIYVCTGVGYWGPPIRIGVPPQISLITLHRENNSV